MMKKLVILLLACMTGGSAFACTNFIVGKKASADGSVFVTYNADSYGAFMPLYHTQPPSISLAICVRFSSGILTSIWARFPK